MGVPDPNTDEFHRLKQYCATNWEGTLIILSPLRRICEEGVIKV
jgi:hypothetical protein